MLMHVLVPDGVFAGGRRMATDLLETNSPAGLACSTREPRLDRRGLRVAALPLSRSDQDQGICPRRSAPAESPAPSSTGRLGGTWIRIVFSKLLDDTTDAPGDPVQQKIIVHPSRDDISRSVGLFDGDRELPTTKYYDPAGSPNDSSDPSSRPTAPPSS